MANSVIICTTSRNVRTTRFLLPRLNKLFTKSTGEKKFSSTSKFAAYGKVCQHKEFYPMLSSLSHIQEEIAQQLITNYPWFSRLAGVVKDKLILFKCT